MADTPPVLLTDQELKDAVNQYIRKVRRYYHPKRWSVNPKWRPSASEHLDVTFGIHDLDKVFEEARRIRWYEEEKRKGRAQRKRGQ